MKNLLQLFIQIEADFFQQATSASANIAGQNSEMVSAIKDIDNAMQMSVESTNKLTNIIAQIEL